MLESLVIAVGIIHVLFWLAVIGFFFWAFTKSVGFIFKFIGYGFLCVSSLALLLFTLTMVVNLF